MNIGTIVQVIGPVVDVVFDRQGVEMPDIYDALEIKRNDGTSLIVECQQHIGENTVRTIAMDSTDGLRRGMEVVATGAPITMPIGDQIKGRLMNVTGEAIDGIGALDRKGGYPIHRKPPKYEDLSTEKEVLYTGIKVIDLIEPYSKGGKIGLFGGAGVQIDRNDEDLPGDGTVATKRHARDADTMAGDNAEFARFAGGGSGPGSTGDATDPPSPRVPGASGAGVGR